MTAKLMKCAALGAALGAALSGAAHAQVYNPPPRYIGPPVEVIGRAYSPPSAESTLRGGGPIGPAVRRAQERGEIPGGRGRFDRDY